MTENKNLVRTTCILLCALILSVFIFFTVRYLALAFLPFILAWGIALSLKTPAEFLEKNAKIPKKAAHIVTTALFAAVTFYLFFLFISMLFREAKEAYAGLSENSALVEGVVKTLSEKVRNTLQGIPYVGKKLSFAQISEGFETKLLGWLQGFLPQLVSLAGSLLGKLIKAVPYAMIFLFVTLISTFYFSADLEKINRTLALLFPEKPRRTLFVIKEELFSVIFGYIRAYSLVIALTFVELFVGLSIIGTKYTFLISFIIAVIDVLPIVGAGTFLIPWGIINISLGNLRTGICLLVLYFIISVTRQMAEPKIIGNFLGLHPLCTLLAMYVGARLCGIWGIFLFPVTFIVIRNVYRRLRSPKQNNEKNQTPSEI